MQARKFAAVCLFACPTALFADIVLLGEQHIGDDTGVTDAVLIPDDNVRRLEHQANPSHFELSSDATITGVRFDNLRSRDGLPRLEIDGLVQLGAFNISNDTFEFDVPLLLFAGVHTIAIDSGCTNPADNPLVAFGSVTCNEDDIGWSSLTLLSNATTTSINLNQRRHLGDNNDGNQYANQHYPDVPEGGFVEYAIVLDRPRQLSAVAMYNIRDVDRVEVFINGSKIGEYSGDDATPFALQTISTTRVLGVGTHTLRLETLVDGSSLDDVSWDDLILSFSNTTTTLPYGFNAVDPAQPGANGVITTKLADEKFQLDIHALTEDGSGASDYDGKVQVDLLDARDDNGSLDVYGCRDSWAFVEKLKDVDFGKEPSKSTGDIEYKQALRIGRIRMTDTDLNLSVCSTDAFAVRPTHITAAATDADETSAGTSRTLNTSAPPPTAGPLHRAGQPFTLAITPRDNGNDALTGLDIDPDLSVAAILPAAIAGVLSPGTWSNPSGTQRITDSARYSDVGAFDLTIDYTKFSAVDAPDTPLANRELLTQISVGRFIPNQFAVSQNIPELSPGCVNHTYLGQAFGFAIPPTLTLTAQNAQGGTTGNYSGGLYRLDNASASAPAFASDQGALTVDSPSLIVTELGGGQAMVSISANSLTLARGAPVEAFDPAVAITTSITDNDGVAALANPQQIGQTTPGNGIGFTGGNGNFRHALLTMDNAYGSPLLDLGVPLLLRFWADLGGGQAGYTLDTQGACIPAIVTASAVTLDQATMAGGTTNANTPTFSAGSGSVVLDAPGAGASGFAAVELQLPAGNAWLLDGANPTARASFGLKRQPDQLIHYREVIR